MEREKFDVTGMTCAACQANVTKAVQKLDGVSQVDVNLLSGSMQVEFDEKKTSIKKIENAVKKIGYGASVVKDNKSTTNNDSDDDEFVSRWKNIQERQRQDLKTLKNRLIFSIILLVPLLYIAMGPMLGLPTFWFFEGAENSVVFALSQLVLTTAVLIINKKFFISGFKALFAKAPNMDSLVAIGSGSAYLYGLVVIFAMAYNLGHGNMAIVEHLMHSLYFESSATILTLVTLGKYFESRSKLKTSNALEKLINLSPKTAVVERDGKEIEIPSKEIQVGDIVVVRSGDTIAVDGEIIEGEGLINQASITGESVPVKKDIGANVISATVCVNGSFKFRASKVGKNTTLSEVIRLVDEASSSKAPISKIADKVSGIFVPIVIGLAVLTFIVWICINQNFENALSNAISVLVISCPCALGLATPVAIMVGTGRASSMGVLIKSAEKLELLSKATVIIFDKTGTITSGSPVLTNFEMLSKTLSENEAKDILFSLEKQSKHAIAYAICESLKSEDVKELKIKEFEEVSGKGVSAKIGKNTYHIGNIKFLKDKLKLKKDDLQNLSEKIKQFGEQGKTATICFSDSEVICLVAVADTVREDSKIAISNLKNLGIKVVMLTGDNAETAKAIANEVGIDEVVSDVMPADKDKVVSNYQKEGEVVVMVGDGINDSPALTRADVGIAVSSGTDIAVDSADVVLAGSSISGVVSAYLLSRAVVGNIKMNLFWAFFYNAISIPIAMGVLIPIFHVGLSPMIASLAMSFSSVFVVLNSLRLSWFNADKKLQKINKKRKKSIKNNQIAENIDKNESIISKNQENLNKGECEMKTIIQVGGMMCAKCEEHVTTAIKKMKGVTDVSIDLNSGEVIISSKKKLAEKDLTKAIEDAGYRLLRMSDSVEEK